eukprot:PITA_22532
MGYLYEAMDRAKESIRAYYDDKGDEGFQKQLLLWEVIDERSNNALHHPIHVAGIYLNLTFSYPCGLIFNGDHGWILNLCSEDSAISSRTYKNLQRNGDIHDGRLESQRLNDMVYVYYNLRLWVRQLERTADMEAISLDGIDITVAWRVDAERPLMESVDDWLE